MSGRNEFLGGQNTSGLKHREELIPQGQVPGGLPATNTSMAKSLVPERRLMLPLPSRGLVYPEGSALCDCKELEITGMKTPQLNIMSNTSFIKNGEMLNRLVQSALTNKEVKVEQMLLADRFVLFTALRISEYGTAYRVGLTCPSCGTKRPEVVDLGTFIDEMKFLELAPLVPHTNIFGFKLPSSGLEAKFRYLTGADEKELYLNQRSKQRHGIVDEQNVTDTLMKVIIELAGYDSKGTINQIIQELPASDTKALLKYMADHEPGVKMRTSFTCYSCDFTGKVGVPVEASFIAPDSNDSE